MSPYSKTREPSPVIVWFFSPFDATTLTLVVVDGTVSVYLYVSTLNVGDTEYPSTYSLPILVAEDGFTALIVIPLYDCDSIEPSLYLPGDFSVI